jgi:hypothetical protein
MWTRSYSTVVKDVSAARLWQVWSDVDRWREWQDDIEEARLESPFEDGGVIHFRPKGGPTLKLGLLDVRAGTAFTDVTRFPLARMYDAHELEERDGGVEVRVRMWLEGPLAFLWRRLVAEKVAGGLPEQTARLIERARKPDDVVRSPTR